MEADSWRLLQVIQTFRVEILNPDGSTHQISIAKLHLSDCVLSGSQMLLKVEN